MSMKRMWRINRHTSPWHQRIEAVTVISETHLSYLLLEDHGDWLGERRQTRESRYQKRHLTLYPSWQAAKEAFIVMCSKSLGEAETRVYKATQDLEAARALTEQVVPSE